MRSEVINGKVVLTADDGKVLTRNGISVNKVTLGVLDKESNWSETEMGLVGANDEISAEEALKIITGGGGDDES